MSLPRVLLVDDDAGLLRLLSLRLANAGYRVLAVESGAQALAQLPVFDPQLIITDLRMPGMDGLELFERVHALHPELPVLMLTAHGPIPASFTAAGGGVFSCLSKPYDSRLLLDCIQRALNRAPDVLPDKVNAR